MSETDKIFEMVEYAELIRLLRPLDDDLEGFQAPVEAIRALQQVVVLCREDFKERYGHDYIGISRE